MRKHFYAAVTGIVVGASLSASPPAEAQISQKSLISFDLEKINKKPPGPTLSLARSLDKKGEREISLEIGESRRADYDRRSPFLSQECGQDCKAKVGWMKVGVTFKFGGP